MQCPILTPICDRTITNPKLSKFNKETIISNLDDDDVSRGLEEKGGVAESRGSGLEMNAFTEMTNEKCYVLSPR